MVKELYTIGHSNHQIDVFLNLLYAYQIDQLIDIRAFPQSRFCPWFNQTALASILEKSNVVYHHLEELGGRRKALPSSINEGWKNKSFRGYADYMQTQVFDEAIERLNKLIANQNRTVMMCAEAEPWRCHRSLVSDAEVARGMKVMHILSKASLKPHELTSFAFIDRTRKPIKVFYPGKNYSLL